MWYPKLIVFAASLILFLTAGHAFVHPIAIVGFSLLACRLSREDLTFAIFVFTTALLARGVVDGFNWTFTALSWVDHGPRLSPALSLVSTACLICQFAVCRYRSEHVLEPAASENLLEGKAKHETKHQIGDSVSDLDGPGCADLMESSDSDGVDSDELNFSVSNSNDVLPAADQPTTFMLPTWSPKQSHFTYDVDPEEVLDELAARLMPQQLLHCLSKSAITIPHVVDVAAREGQSTACLIETMIAGGTLTKLQAMLICGGFPELLWIGNYEVLERIGRGGMAIVLRVRDRHTKHIYALKLLANLNAIDAVMRHRFLREMEAVRELAHPNIAIARAVGEHNQSLYIAMEWVQGCNLAWYVQQRGPLPPQEAIDFIRQAAAALQHAHQRGLIHRDVKPANLMLDKKGVIKLVDMGLARFADSVERSLDPEANGWKTDTGHLMGTIDYMAPEQAIDLGLADHRSDIYSLGCTLFYLLTGASHLRGQTQRGRAVGLVRQTGMQRLADLRKDLCECLYVLADKMMAVAPDQRFQSIGELVTAIDDCASQMGMPAQVGNPYHVLVVEDSPTQSMMICQQLKATSRHFLPLDVPTLATACECLQSQTVDIVLLDLNLPDSRGIATIERIRQVHESVPILILTNSNDPEVGIACIAAGADDYLPKDSLQVSTLERHILLILSRRASTRT